MSKTQTEKVVKLPTKISVGNLADKLNIEISQLIKTMLDNGIVANVNDLIDYDIAAILAEEFGIVTEELDNRDQKDDQNSISDRLAEILERDTQNKKELKKRPPIVTVLGHVDHGKTTLLDTLKKTKLAEKEAGGITQHINSYQVKENNRLITFIDTPGHEAFQAMRERGASIADIAILVVAADDGVKPQTKEVIDFLLTKNIPTVVAINKIDKPTANTNKVKQELAEHKIFLEGYGGDIPYNEISAKNNINLDKLLETVLLVADINEIKGNYDSPPVGIVLEAKKDPRKGPLANIIIKNGTLKVGQDVIVGNIKGRIRKIEDYTGKNIKEATPSMPATIYGLPEVPNNNDLLEILTKEKEKELKEKHETVSLNKNLDSSTIIKNIDAALKNKFPIILKADTQGSLEALEQVLETLPKDEIVLKIIQKGVGPITEKDIQTAESGEAIIYGFNVYPTQSASQFGKKTKIVIKSFKIIYELIEDIKDEMSNRLEPEIKRTDLGKLKVLAIFKNMKKGMIVGGKVTTGKMVKNEQLEVLRDKEVIGKGILTQLQQNKEDVSEVKENFECGLTFSGNTKIEVGDTIRCFKEEEIKRKI